MPELNIREVRIAAILLILGWVVFWVGAFSPPLKQWISPLKEYLEIIAENRLAWFWINGCFVVGVLLTASGLSILTIVLYSAGDRILSSLGLISFLFGSILWIISLAFRLTVTVLAAQETMETSIIPSLYLSLHQWSGLMFAIYMVLAYLSIGAYGGALIKTELLADWLGWTSLVFGLAGAVLFIARIPLFDPPAMIHIIPGVIGIYLLLKY